MKRTNLVLLGLAIALFGYVTLVDRHGLSSGDLDERKGRFVEALVRDRLVGIEVEREGLRYSLARQERDADGNLSFAFETPLHVAADSERVADSLATLEWAEPTRILEGADVSDRRRYGLDRPRLRVRLEVGDRTLVVAFGEDEPTGAGVYASVDGSVFVVAPEVRDAFDHPIEFFRVRSLVSVPESFESLRIVSPSGELRIVRANGVFRIAAPEDVSASDGRVNVVLATLRTLEAERFADENPTDLARYGLAEPRLRLELGDAEHPSAVSLAVGGPCDSPADSSAVRVGDGPVACVANDDLDPLFVAPPLYRELRASATESGGVASVDLSDGRATLSIRNQDERLRYSLAGVEGDADPEAFEEWIESLRETRALGTRPVDPGFTPTHTLTVHRTGTRADDVIRFALRADGVLARRGDDSVLLVFPRSLAERLVVSASQVRARGLLHADPSALRELTITRGAAVESIAIVGDQVRVVTPVEVAAEDARVAELASRLAGLEAVRFVAETPTPEFALDRPRLQVRFILGDATHVLAIGADAGGGDAYARLDGTGPVFVVVAATVELVATPLASRQELASGVDEIESITIERAAVSVALERDGVHFTRAGAPFEDARAEAVLGAVAELRPDAVAGYGAARPDQGLARPSATIRIRRTAEAGEPRVVVLSIGASRGSGEDAVTYVRRADLPVVYEVPVEALAPLLGL